MKDTIASIYGDVASPIKMNFAIAVPDASLLPTAKINKSVIHALRKSKDHCIGYENTQGNIDLRKQIVKLAFNWGGKFKADDIIVTSGCLEAINLCLRAVTQNGDTVAVESPNYFGIYQSLENMGLKVGISSNPSTGLDIDCWKSPLRNLISGLVLLHPISIILPQLYA